MSDEFTKALKVKNGNVECEYTEGFSEGAYWGHEWTLKYADAMAKALELTLTLAEDYACPQDVEADVKAALNSYRKFKEKK